MKTNYELLAENPEAMQRFCEALEREATVIGIEIEIRKLSDTLREQVCFARANNIDPSGLLEHRRNQKHDLLLACAYAIGKERGQRIGKEHAQLRDLEGQTFKALQAEKYAFLILGKAKGESND